MFHKLSREFLDRMMSRFLINYYSGDIHEIPRPRYSPKPAWSFRGEPISGYEMIDRMGQGIDKAVEEYPELETARRRFHKIRSQRATLAIFREEFRLAVQQRNAPELTR